MKALQGMFDRDYVPDAEGNRHGGLLALLKDVRELARLYDLDFEVACDQSDVVHELLPMPPHAGCPWCKRLGMRCDRCAAMAR